MIKIYCSSSKCLNLLCKVLIYDVHNKLLYKSITNYLGQVIYNPPPGIYKIIVCHKNKTICRTIYLRKNEIINVNFKFNFSLIKVFLTDKNYTGLPIEKGEISFGL